MLAGKPLHVIGMGGAGVQGDDIQCITTAGLLLHCEGDPVDSLQVSSSQLYARLKQEC